MKKSTSEGNKIVKKSKKVFERFCANVGEIFDARYWYPRSSTTNQ